LQQNETFASKPLIKEAAPEVIISSSKKEPEVQTEKVSPEKIEPP
jgi:hypothetical protein